MTGKDRGGDAPPTGKYWMSPDRMSGLSYFRLPPSPAFRLRLSFGGQVGALRRTSRRATADKSAGYGALRYFLPNWVWYGKIYAVMKAADLIKELVWEEIADDLSRESGEKKALCLGEDFYAYLDKEVKLPFKLEKASSKAKGRYGLIIGWGILPAKGPPTVLKRIYKLLKKGGEVRLWGFYNQPHRDDLILWEGKLRKREEKKSFPARLPGAISLARISGCVKGTPFEHYVIRKEGIRYQTLLKK